MLGRQPVASGIPAACRVQTYRQSQFFRFLDCKPDGFQGGIAEKSGTRTHQYCISGAYFKNGKACNSRIFKCPQFFFEPHGVHMSAQPPVVNEGIGLGGRGLKSFTKLQILFILLGIYLMMGWQAQRQKQEYNGDFCFHKFTNKIFLHCNRVTQMTWYLRILIFHQDTTKLPVTWSTLKCLPNFGSPSSNEIRPLFQGYLAL